VKSLRPTRRLTTPLVLYQGARVSTHVVCLLSRAGRVRSPRSSRLAPESSVGRDRYTRGVTAISWGAFLLSRVRVTAVPRTRQGRSDERPTPRARLPPERPLLERLVVLALRDGRRLALVSSMGRDCYPVGAPVTSGVGFQSAVSASEPACRSQA
jgi:hypothetical protein